MSTKKTLIASVIFFAGLSCFSQRNDEDGIFKKVNNQGLDIYFRVFGEGQPLLLIGGGPGDHSDRYLRFAKGLGENFQCILVEQRGIGNSTPQVLDTTTVTIALTLADFEKIRTSLGFEQWAVLGFSFGGYISSLYVSAYPESVSSLILLESIGLNTNVFSYFMDNVTSRLSESDKLLVEYWRDSTRMAENYRHALTEWIRAIMPGYFYDREKSLLISENIRGHHFSFDMGRLIWKDIVKRKLDLTAVESSFSNPVLILHGRQDPVGESVPLALSDYYERSKLVFIEKCGHYPWVEQPQIVYPEIKRFLNQ